MNIDDGKLKGDELKNAFLRAEDEADKLRAPIDPNTDDAMGVMQDRITEFEAATGMKVKVSTPKGDDQVDLLQLHAENERRFTIISDPDVKVETHDYRFRPDFGDNRPYWHNPSRVFTDFMALQLPMSEMQPGHIFRFVRAPFLLNEAAIDSLRWQYLIFKTERVLHILHHDNTVREDLMVRHFGTSRARKLLRRAERLQRDAAQ